MVRLRNKRRRELVGQVFIETEEYERVKEIALREKVSKSRVISNLLKEVLEQETYKEALNEVCINLLCTEKFCPKTEGERHALDCMNCTSKCVDEYREYYLRKARNRRNARSV